VATTARSPAVRRHADGRVRCAWCGEDPLYVHYHDTEWGVPMREDAALFELLCLEGAQAGLSWITVLRKREHYRRAFDGFDATQMARYTPKREAALMQNPGIVRNRLKISAFVSNARAFLELQEAGEGLADLVWSHRSAGRRARPRSREAVPASTPESDALSKALKRRGFRFVGTTICYAFMQAAGVVDDHQASCWVRPIARSGA